MSTDLEAIPDAGRLTPAGMRARAEGLRTAVRESSRQNREQDRTAAQLDYEAGLIEYAELARVEYEGSLPGIPALEAAPAKALAAKRTAEDRLISERRKLDRVSGDQAKADPADGDQQEILAVRAHVREKAVAVCETQLAEAAGRHSGAVRALRDAEKLRDELHGEWQREQYRAEHPGRAPYSPGIAPGVSGVSDMTEDQQQAIQLLMVAVAAGAGRSPEPAPARVTRFPGGLIGIRSAQPRS